MKKIKLRYLSLFVVFFLIFTIHFPSYKKVISVFCLAATTLFQEEATLEELLKVFPQIQDLILSDSSQGIGFEEFLSECAKKYPKNHFTFRCILVSKLLLRYLALFVKMEQQFVPKEINLKHVKIAGNKEKFTRKSPNPFFVLNEGGLKCVKLPGNGVESVIRISQFKEQLRNLATSQQLKDFSPLILLSFHDSVALQPKEYVKIHNYLEQERLNQSYLASSL